MGESLLRVALRWLAHPVSLVAIGVMVLNDHVLKQAYGTWWTGKLSDVAGLIFFPALVAVVVAGVARVLRRPEVRGPDVAAVVITGLGFVWVKATWAGAATASAVLTAITGPLFGSPSLMRADVTDLLALPALGLAAWVAGRVETRGEPRAAEVTRPSPRRRAFAVAMVPLAILASVATSAASRAQVSVVDDGHGGWVALAGDWDSNAYRLTDAGWRPAPTPDEPLVPVPMACSDVHPDWCFRTVSGELAVDQSSDGGETWETAWELSADDLRALSDAYYRLGGLDGAPVSSGVGVFDGADGFTVVVGNGMDGLLVRGIDGGWERVAFEGLDCCESSELVPLPTRWSPYGTAIPPAIAWGLAVLTVVSAASLLVAHGRLRGWRTGDGSAREWVAHVLGWAGVLTAAAAAINVGPVESQTGEGAWYPEVRVALYVVEIIVVGVLAVVAFSLAGGGRLRAQWRLTLFSLAVSLTVGALVVAVPGAGWWDAAVALPVGIAAVWLASGRLAFHAEDWGITPFFQRVEHSREEHAEIEASVVRTMAALAPVAEAEAEAPAQAEADPVHATWTAQDALLLTCIGPGRVAGDLRAVLINAKAIDGSYFGLVELEEGIGRLEASGLVKVVRPGWFRATKQGRAVLTAGGRPAPGFAAQAGSDRLSPDALREVECRSGRVRIGREAFRSALGRALGA